MSLRQAIREEISKALQSVEDTSEELDRRSRPDRMKEVGSDRDQQWYETGKEEAVRDKVRQIVSEEYRQLRVDSDETIEHRSGLRDFEIKESGGRDRWYEDENGEVDEEKVAQTAKKMATKVIRERKPHLPSFSNRAAQARDKSTLVDLGLEMKNVMGASRFNEEVIQGMGNESLRDMITYFDRMFDLSRGEGQSMRQIAKDTRDSTRLYEMAKQIEDMLGEEKFALNVLKQMEQSELESTISYIDRMHNLS